MRLRNLVFWVFFTIVLSGPPEDDMDTCQLIELNGYNCETHTVLTTDGYLLTSYRIPNNGPPVFYQHGLMDSSDSAVINGKNDSLAFHFFDLGYDVWLGNNRGNKYSRAHVSLNPDSDKRFWKFSFNEMGEADLPANVDYILKETSHQGLYFIGHSQGTSQAFANFAGPNSVASKIIGAVMLAPIARLYHMTSLPFKIMSTLHIDNIVHFFESGEFMPTTAFLHKYVPYLCSKSPSLCENSINWFFGLDTKYIDSSKLSTYFSHFPSGTSADCVEHYAQLVRHNKFSRYDYGWFENHRRYHQFTAPVYDLSMAKLPRIALYHGGLDELADETDMKWLQSTLSQVDHVQFYPDFDHFTFVLGSQNNELLYPDIAMFMEGLGEST